MAPQTASTNEEWLESIMRQMFSQGRSASKKSSKGPAAETNASYAARDARRFARMALQMAIGILDAADEKQDEAERLFQSRLEAMEKEHKAEKQRAAQEEHQRQTERARQAEVEEMRRSMERLQQEGKELTRILEERKREAIRQRDEAERRAAEQAAAEALKQAQAEAKRYREAAQRAQKEAAQTRERAERAEAEAQRQNAARAKSDQTLGGQKESAAWSRYTDQWELFKRFALAVGPNPGGVLRFEDLPWPMLSSPASPSMITRDEVAAFLYSSSGPGQPLKARIRECLLIWHPDKFSGRWMKLVLEKDRARVIEGVSAVTRAGNEIMAECTNRRNTL
ncbi:hypothetical protein FRC07_003077 [Ceratobasidium sp. 392]|nr:hypothetical protein FRC07_003077 [Ceratobasidium sp. 392]